MAPAMSYGPKPLPIRFRILINVEKIEGGCWLWKCHCDKDGYGQINLSGQTIRAHRVSYEEFIGPIPDGKCVLHSCDVRRCVNPNHLFTGTQLENVQDMCRKGRFVAQIGEEHGRAKLSEVDIFNIRCNPLSQGKIANQYGVSQSLISRIKNQHRWRHIS